MFLDSYHGLTSSVYNLSKSDVIHWNINPVLEYYVCNSG